MLMPHRFRKQEVSIIKHAFAQDAMGILPLLYGGIFAWAVPESTSEHRPLLVHFGGITDWFAKAAASYCGGSILYRGSAAQVAKPDFLRQGDIMLDPKKHADWEIAWEAEKNMKTIHHIAEVLGLEKNELLPYGHYMGKVDFRAVLDRLGDRPNGKYVDVYRF